jgi:hypothetical protein
LGLDGNLGQPEGTAGQAPIEAHTLTVGPRTWKMVNGS